MTTGLHSQYVLALTSGDGEDTRTLTPDNDTPAALAQAVHHHARGMAGSRTVDVHLDADQQGGTIWRAGVEMARFTLTPLHHPTGPHDHQTPAEPGMHGYTLSDVHHLASNTVRWDRWHRASDVADRYDAAWHAIVEQLLTAELPPTRRELLTAGQHGIDVLVRQGMQAHGYDHHAGTGRRPRFEAFWTSTAAHTPSPEERIIERHALKQIWPTLTPRQQSALTALAATGDYAQAAHAISSSLATFHVLISHARKRFLAQWHEHERPSRPWGTDRRVGSRTSNTTPNSPRRPATRAVTRRTGRPRSASRLTHGRASTYTNHACRCTACTQAASTQARERNRAKGATPRRRITVSQLADIRSRTATENVPAIAADVGFSATTLYRLLNGSKNPAPDPT